MSSKRRIAKAIRTHRNEQLEKQGKNVYQKSTSSKVSNVANASSNSLSAGTGGEVVLLSSKTVELGANIKLAAAAWKRKLEEEERKKRQRQGNKRKRPKVKNRFKRTQGRKDLVTTQRQKLLKTAHFDMQRIWKAGRDLKTWNATEIFHNFLFLGAGSDGSGRCLMNMPGDTNVLKAEKMAFYYHNNVRFVLNMSGSPLQKELKGNTYPVDTTFLFTPPKLIPMNDVDTIDETMTKMFDFGAMYIEKAFQAHLEHYANLSSEQKENPGTNRPPSIFVHCVSGVHRSPMVVVWWMVKHHGWAPIDAWNPVRHRRDASYRKRSDEGNLEKRCIGGDHTTGRKRLWFSEMIGSHRNKMWLSCVIL